MTQEEYNEKMKAAKLELERKQDAINIEYAESNNPYKVGDIIEDHIGKGQIISWSPTKLYLENYPCLLYKCHNLLKSGKVSKKEPIRNIYQRNIIKSNEK